MLMVRIRHNHADIVGASNASNVNSDWVTGHCSCIHKHLIKIIGGHLSLMVGGCGFVSTPLLGFH